MTSASPASRSSPHAAAEGPLALIAGGGAVPLAVADAATRQGRRVVMFPVRGWADATTVAGHAHHWIALVQTGRFLRLARQEGGGDVGARWGHGGWLPGKTWMWPRQAARQPPA